MDNPTQAEENLARKIAAVAKSTPRDLLEPILPKFMDWDHSNWQLSKSKVLAVIRNRQIKADFQDLLGYWERECPHFPGASIALAIRSALITSAEPLHSQIELVWTGPESKVLPFRRTDQALLELIHAAKEKLIIVSFAVYKIQPIVDALEQAVRRNVKLVIILETPEESDGKVSFAGVSALSKEILSGAKLFVWPFELRPQSEDGKHGSLHAKFAVADEEILFVSSANLTEYAMNLNMEMGVLLRGGELPKQVNRHIERLISLGHLRLWDG